MRLFRTDEPVRLAHELWLDEPTDDELIISLEELLMFLLQADLNPAQLSEEGWEIIDDRVDDYWLQKPVIIYPPTSTSCYCREFLPIVVG